MNFLGWPIVSEQVPHKHTCALKCRISLVVFCFFGSDLVYVQMPYPPPLKRKSAETCLQVSQPLGVLQPLSAQRALQLFHLEQQFDDLLVRSRVHHQ